MRHRVQVENPPAVATPDGDGGAVNGDWTTIVDTRAAIETLSADEQVAVGTVSPRATHAVTLRYVAGVTSQARVRFGARVLSLVAPPINVDERNRELRLLCVERFEGVS